MKENKKRGKGRRRRRRVGCKVEEVHVHVSVVVVRGYRVQCWCLCEVVGAEPKVAVEVGGVDVGEGGVVSLEDDGIRGSPPSVVGMGVAVGVRLGT